MSARSGRTSRRRVASATGGSTTCTGASTTTCTGGSGLRRSTGATGGRTLRRCIRAESAPGRLARSCTAAACTSPGSATRSSNRVRGALVVERGALVLPFIPHSTEDRAGMETDTEADEERDQRDHDAGRAIALLTRGDLVREEERRDDSETGDTGTGCHAGREHS